IYSWASKEIMTSTCGSTSEKPSKKRARNASTAALHVAEGNIVEWLMTAPGKCWLSSVVSRMNEVGSKMKENDAKKEKTTSSCGSNNISSSSSTARSKKTERNAAENVVVSRINEVGDKIEDHEVDYSDDDSFTSTARSYKKRNFCSNFSQYRWF
ncbi:hypothetical protein L195_g039862, partial [Trifolium pratense]